MMADVHKEPTDAEVASKTGFGETADELEEVATDSEEEAEAEEEAEESAESAKEEDESSASTKEVASDTEEDTESDDAEDESEEEESEDEETGESKAEDKRTVPYSLLKSKNAEIKSLKKELDDARAKKEEAAESGDDEAVEDADKEVQETAKKLGEELGLDEAGISKILAAAVKLSSKKSVLPKDIEEKLKTLDELKAKDTQNKEVEHFRNEWNTLDIRKQYPNASKSALGEAQKLMDDLSHSKEYHKYDLDYILFKNKSKFETILKTAPKTKSGEIGKRISKDASDDAGEDDENLVDIENLTPEIMKKREARERTMRREHMSDKDYTVRAPKEGN